MIAYCEVCGVLIGEGTTPGMPEGGICEACFASRRVIVAGEGADGPPLDDPPDGVVQFACIYCRAFLRLQAVLRRTRIRCPRCEESFFLLEDGGVQARLEGGDTAILHKDEFVTPTLTPAGGVASLPPPDHPHNKTQPLRKAALVAPTPPAGHELRLEQREAAEDEPEESGPLELLPEAIGPGEAPRARSREPVELRPSDEGQIDLDASGLKHKTRKVRRGGLRRGDSGPTRRDDAGPTRRDDTAQTRRLSAEEQEARHQEEERRREEQTRRAAEAARKAEELVARTERRALASVFLVALFLLPALAALSLVGMTSRGAGFASRGAVGAFLEDVGGRVDAGARALNQLLPEGVRDPNMPPDRPRGD